MGEHRQRLRAQGMRPIQIWVLMLIAQEDGFAERDSVTMCMSSSDPTDLPVFRISVEPTPDGTYQESCPLGVLELSTFLKLTSI